VQRWSTVALGCVALLAFAFLLWWGGTRQQRGHDREHDGALRGPGTAGSPYSGSLALPGGSASSGLPLAPPSVDSALLPLPSASPAAVLRPLPPGAPRHVRFGVVLVKYRGAELAGGIDRSRSEALAIARAIAELAKKDFNQAVKHGDPGSEADAGRIGRGILEPALESELFLLPPGGVAGPLDTPRGYWVMRRIELHEQSRTLASHHPENVLCAGTRFRWAARKRRGRWEFMATIDIRRTHSLSSEDARAKGEELAKSMQEKLGIQWKWAGDKITFDAPSGLAKGANGAVSFGATEVRVEIDLPFLLKAMKGTIEGKVKEKLDALL
jgi:putative polyhydroxyalkanoate system protein